MKKYLAALLATMLCVCCLGLAACGDSGSSSNASSSAAPESSAAAESESTAADPSEKFIGDWKLAGLETNGVTVIGDLSAMEIGTATLNIAADGTGEIGIDDSKATFTWKQKDEDTLSVEVKNDSEETLVNGTTEAVFQDDTVRITIKTDDQEGSIIFSKDGNVSGMAPIAAEDATNITSKEALIGTWKISGISYEGATMYGDSESLATMNGSEEMILVFDEGGTATLLGAEATWSADENGAFVNDAGTEIAVKALGDDIIINFGEPYGIEMYMVFSK